MTADHSASQMSVIVVPAPYTDNAQDVHRGEGYPFRFSSREGAQRGVFVFLQARLLPSLKHAVSNWPLAFGS